MQPRPWHESYDDGVPRDVAFEDVTLPGLLDGAVARFPDRPALIFLNRVITYRALKEEVDRCATALARLGVVPGTRVAIQTPNLPQFVIAYYGTLAAGGIAVPTNPLYTPRELEHQWNDAGCEVAIVMDFLWAQKVRALREKVPIKQYIVASIPEYLRFPLSLLAPLKLKRQSPPLYAAVQPEPNVHRFRDLVRATPPAPPSVAMGIDDVATLLYTGGTTGLSKGATLTHRNMSYNVQQLRAWLAGAELGREVILGAMPFFHSYGITVVLNNGVNLGATIVLQPNPRDYPAIIKGIEKHRATLFPAAPAQYNAIRQFPGIDKRDLSSIKFCNSGSAPLPLEVLEGFEQLTGSKITEGFGLTETSPVTHSNPLYTRRKVGSIGVPLPSTDAKIVDMEAGTRELPMGEVGELIIAGPQVMKGYWNKPDATAEMIRDGWLYTGDLARVDEDGFFFIEGRKKDMLLCSGYNVYPDEIDRVLTAHPAVLEAGTIGLPDPKRGETPKSFVVLKPGAQATAEELLAHCREELAAYKVPSAIEFRSELPKSAVLKVLRRQLREEELRKQRAAGVA